MAYEHILSPIRIGSITLRNRIIMGAMGSNTANDDATVSECECAYYAERAKGGCGLIINEVTRVNDKTGVMMARQTSAASDDKIPGLKKLADSVHFYDGKIFLQLHHPGRQSSCAVNQGRPLLTPSGVESMLLREKCRPMTHSEIQQLIQDFVDAAERCHKAGIDGVELHAAHGYLLNQFLSPFTNKRTDEYGGSTENRSRVIKEIIEGIRKRLGREYPVIMRISADEFLQTSVFPIKETGLQPDEAVRICQYLVPFGLDAVSVSAGVYETMNTAWEPASYPEGWKLYLAEEIKRAVPVPVFGVGTLRNPDFIEQALAEDRIDCAVLSRAQLADPEWVNKVSENRISEIRRCISCLNCMDTLQQDKTSPFSCAVNARAAREWKFNDNYRPGRNRPVAVIGGGPSGCEAARVLAERGFRVTLFEKLGQLGGQLRLASKPPFKGKISWLIEWYELQLEKLGVEVRLHTPVSLEALRKLQPYAVFVGTGSDCVIPRSIEGISRGNVCTSTDILNGSVHPLRQNVIIAGSGMTGMETAEFLAVDGNKITIVEMADTIGPGASWQNLSDLMSRLSACHPTYLPSHRLSAVRSDGAVLEQKDGEKIFLPADLIVLSLGVKADQTVALGVEAAFEKVYRIGDTLRTGRIANAVTTAFEAAYKLR